MTRKATLKQIAEAWGTTTDDEDFKELAEWLIEDGVLREDQHGYKFDIREVEVYLNGLNRGMKTALDGIEDSS